MAHLQSEQEENEKLMKDLTEQLKTVEDEAGEIMKSCQEAEVSVPLIYDSCVTFLIYSCFLEICLMGLNLYTMEKTYKCFYFLL